MIIKVGIASYMTKMILFKQSLTDRLKKRIKYELIIFYTMRTNMIAFK